MEQLLDDELKGLFPPDITKSMMVDVLRQCKGDKEQAKEIAKGMAGAVDNENQKIQERKIKELKETFAELGEEDITAVLTQNGWDVDTAIMPLLTLMEKKQSEDKKQKQQQKNQKERDDAFNFFKQYVPWKVVRKENSRIIGSE